MEGNKELADLRERAVEAAWSAWQRNISTGRMESVVDAVLALVTSPTPADRAAEIANAKADALQEIADVLESEGYGRYVSNEIIIRSNLYRDEALATVQPISKGDREYLIMHLYALANENRGSVYVPAKLLRAAADALVPSSPADRAAVLEEAARIAERAQAGFGGRMRVHPGGASIAADIRALAAVQPTEVADRG